MRSIVFFEWINPVQAQGWREWGAGGVNAQKYGEGKETRVVMCVYWTLRRRLVELAGSVRPGGFGLQRSKEKDNARGCSA